MAIYVALPILIIALHLVAIKKGWRVVKSVSKVLIMPYLFLAFSAFTGSKGIYVPCSGLLAATVVLYTIGDLLLEFDNAFLYGGISFSIGHVLYSAAFLSFGYSMGWGLIFIGLWMFIYIFLFEPVLVKARPNSTKYILYATFVAMLGISVGAADFNGAWLAKVVAVAGTLCFAFSDALVIIRQTSDQSEEERVDDDLLIMATYVGANILLFSSIALLCAF